MILIVGNGSQYTHLIKRNCREMGHDAEVINRTADEKGLDSILEKDISSIILSGGPHPANEPGQNVSSIICQRAKDSEIRVPILGICYGHQMIGKTWGSEVGKGKSAGYGLGEIDVCKKDILFDGIPDSFNVWVSHYDELKTLPEGFTRLAYSDGCEIEAMRHNELPVFGVQFHPEVWHTDYGENILANFINYANGI
jgi:GMP synthase (glutamine-hydrolysing)